MVLAAQWLVDWFHHADGACNEKCGFAGSPVRQARENEENIQEALPEAGTVRLRIILMTTASMIFGVLSVALGNGAGAGLCKLRGIVLIGGLITSTGLVLISTFCLLLDEVNKKLKLKEVR